MYKCLVFQGYRGTIGNLIKGFTTHVFRKNLEQGQKERKGISTGWCGWVCGFGGLG